MFSQSKFFLQKYALNKCQNLPIRDFWRPLWARFFFNIKTRKFGPRGLDFGSFFEPRFANLKNLKFAAMRGVS